MLKEDFGITDMTESGFLVFKSNDINTTTGESNFSAASSRSSRDSKKKSKKKKSSKCSKKERGEWSPKSTSDVNRDALFEKMLDAMGGKFTGALTHSDFGDFGDANAKKDFQSQDLNAADEQYNMSKKNGRSGNNSTRSPGTNATGTTGTTATSRNTGFINVATSANLKLTFENIAFPEENLFDPGFDQNHPDPFEDDDSVLSDVSGLTGVFLSDQTAMYDDEDDEGYLPEILPIQSHAAHVAPTGSTKQKNRIAKELRFATVETRYYERILTLNPSTIQGPSIGIGWRFSGERTDELDFYEKNRGRQRPSGMLVLKRDQRENLLLDLGYTKKQLAVGVRDNTKGRNQRRQTVQNFRAEKVEEALEGAKRRFKRILNPFAKRKA